MKQITQSTQIKIDRILDLLSKRPMGSMELAEHIFCTQGRANKLLRHLRDAKQVYRAGFRKSEKAIIVPLYRAGDKPDATRQKDSRIVRNRRYWSALKKDTERYLQTKVNPRKAKRIAARAVKTPTNWLSAITGASA